MGARRGRGPDRKVLVKRRLVICLSLVVTAGGCGMNWRTLKRGDTPKGATNQFFLRQVKSRAVQVRAYRFFCLIKFIREYLLYKVPYITTNRKRQTHGRTSNLADDLFVFANPF